MQRVSPFDSGDRMRNCSVLNDTQEQNHCEWMVEWVSLQVIAFIQLQVHVNCYCVQESVYPFAVNMLILECLLVVVANFIILMTRCFLYGRTTAPLACIYR